MLKKARNYIDNQMMKAKAFVQEKVEEAKELIENKEGDSLTTSQLIWIIVVVVIVLIIAGLLVTFIKSEFFPAFKAKLQEILNLT